VLGSQFQGIFSHVVYLGLSFLAMSYAVRLVLEEF